MTEELNRAYELLSDKLIGWFNAIVKNIPNLIIAIIVLVVFYLSFQQYHYHHQRF